MKLSKKLRSLVAIGAMVLFVAGTTTSAYSETTEDRNFSIEVTATPNLCEQFDLDYPSGNPATWMVDQDVTLTDINDMVNSSPNNLSVEEGTTVEMSLNLNFQNGSTCDPNDGMTTTLFPGGTVTAAWTLPGFTSQLESCPAPTGCSANSTSSVFAQMSTPLNSPAIYSGSVAVTWVP